MSEKTVTLIPGDGIGPETCGAMRRVVEATGVSINWEIMQAGANCIEEYGTPLPTETLESIKKNKVAIKGPVTTPVGEGFRSVNVALRKELNLYVCLRPVCSIPGAGGRYDDVDLVIIRENTEDLYAGIEFEKGSDSAKKLIDLCFNENAARIRCDSGISIKAISETATRAIVEYAFDYAIKNNRKKITAVHKANIMKFSDGLFLSTARDVADQYKGCIEFEDRIVDAFCMGMVMDPTQFDVVVLPNLYGDIASDLAAGLVGGLGIAPGANIGDDYAVFEAVHGSAPDIAGKNLCNPTAEILSAAMMLDYIGKKTEADIIRIAIQKVYGDGNCLTGDIRRVSNDSKPATCSEFTDAVVQIVKQQ